MNSNPLAEGEPSEGRRRGTWRRRLLVAGLALLAVLIAVYEAWASLSGREVTITHLTRALSNTCLLFPVVLGMCLGYLICRIGEKGGRPHG